MFMSMYMYMYVCMCRCIALYVCDVCDLAVQLCCVRVLRRRQRTVLLVASDRFLNLVTENSKHITHLTVTQNLGTSTCGSCVLDSRPGDRETGRAARELSRAGCPRPPTLQRGCASKLHRDMGLFFWAGTIR